MGQIALKDNPRVGGEIVKILNGEIAKAVKIGADFLTSVGTTGRFRRQASNGEKAYEGVAQVLVDSDKNIANEKKDLSPSAQNQITEEHRAGLAKCGANACKAATAANNKVEGAQDQRKG